MPTQVWKYSYISNWEMLFVSTLRDDEAVKDALLITQLCCPLLAYLKDEWSFCCYNAGDDETLFVYVCVFV